jgi:hypothetical protein
LITQATIEAEFRSRPELAELSPMVIDALARAALRVIRAHWPVDAHASD